MKMNNKGMLLMTTYFIITILMFFVGLFAFKNLWEARAVERYKQTTQAFHAADAGMDAALVQLPGNVAGLTNVSLTDSDGQVRGTYSTTTTIVELGKKWRVESWGYVPNAVAPTATRHLECYAAIIDPPAELYDNAIYTAGNVLVNGNSYSIQGDVMYAGTTSPLGPPNLTGAATHDPTISPLFRFDFDVMRAKAQAQIKADGSNNLYTAAEIATGNPPLPATFWFDKTDPDPTKWIPNVVYVETDLILNGKINIGGFLLVVGDVVNDPDETNETTINGTGTVDGCVYSTGQFRVNGGGKGLNVLGGIWSGSDGVRLNGNVKVEYNADYMSACERWSAGNAVQLLSWREVNQ